MDLNRPIHFPFGQFLVSLRRFMEISKRLRHTNTQLRCEDLIMFNNPNTPVYSYTRYTGNPKKPPVA